jgi:hypothetical protein
MLHRIKVTTALHDKINLPPKPASVNAKRDKGRDKGTVLSCRTLGPVPGVSPENRLLFVTRSSLQ